MATILIGVDDTGALDIHWPALLQWAYGGEDIPKAKAAVALYTLEAKLKSIRTDHLGDEP